MNCKSDDNKDQSGRWRISASAPERVERDDRRSDRWIMGQVGYENGARK